MRKTKLSCIVLFIIALATTSYADDYSTSSRSSEPRYTFSWPLDDAAALKPRGGTTKGAPIVLDTSPSSEWQSLQAQDISNFERDRRAILAMAGTYRVTFDFLEVAPFDTAQTRNAPYQSWGTEKVYVDRDAGRQISLVHILEMRMVQKDGAISEPMVTKHWRQDWQYEPKHIVEYQGHERWERRNVPTAKAKGAWLQTVYQVDESPRYASIGQWQHSSSFSSWISDQTWRPLPRREWSVRDDYHVLIGTNRHTVYPTGWTQEENNLKTALSADRTLRVRQPYLAREYGMARYERIKDADFAAADKYYAATKQFWHRVRDTWAAAFAEQGAITLRGPIDKLGLFMPLFAHADAIASGTVDADTATVIHDALRDMGALQ